MTGTALLGGRFAAVRPDEGQRAVRVRAAHRDPVQPQPGLAFFVLVQRRLVSGLGGAVKD
ncbi:hypothetical protein QWM81_06335 [Streptomyces ficellus]|uniref:Uncharacterized protein n=1 Tax=Streptomyces ficellus TaxID=1977088 RepID=A0ABT7Z3G2_9ACTN|nr:hypothetical protein [Streptomyces ficellus]MDN3293666.1 hypothetical protein [Streptomyces ficellus]